MRIVSLLPSATEIVFAIGAGDDLVAVSHECNYPREARRLPAVTAPAIDTTGMPAREIDAAIASLEGDGAPAYRVDAERLAELRPDVILTQALCEVCAVSDGQVHRLVHERELGAQVVTLSPGTLDAIFESIEQVGDAIERGDAAHRLAEALRGEMDGFWERRPEEHPRVAALEWLDPPFASGHWIPEMVEAAGGVEVLGHPGEKSFRTTWEAVANEAPEVIVLLPCGMNIEAIAAAAGALASEPLWATLPAVEQGAVWAVDADALFSRPGPRVAEGVRVLARILADPHAAEPIEGAIRLSDV